MEGVWRIDGGTRDGVRPTTTTGLSGTGGSSIAQLLGPPESDTPTPSPVGRTSSAGVSTIPPQRPSPFPDRVLGGRVPLLVQTVADGDERGLWVLGLVTRATSDLGRRGSLVRLSWGGPRVGQEANPVNVRVTAGGPDRPGPGGDGVRRGVWQDTGTSRGPSKVGRLRPPPTPRPVGRTRVDTARRRAIPMLAHPPSWTTSPKSPGGRIPGMGGPVETGVRGTWT